MHAFISACIHGSRVTRAPRRAAPALDILSTQRLFAVDTSGVTQAVFPSRQL